MREGTKANTRGLCRLVLVSLRCCLRFETHPSVAWAGSGLWWRRFSQKRPPERLGPPASSGNVCSPSPSMDGFCRFHIQKHVRLWDFSPVAKRTTSFQVERDQATSSTRGGMGPGFLCHCFSPLPQHLLPLPLFSSLVVEGSAPWPDLSLRELICKPTVTVPCSFLRHWAKKTPLCFCFIT